MAITARSQKNYQVEIQAGRHTFISDEPAGVGDDAGPGPFDLLLSALASCTIITLHMYARRKNWPLERVELSMLMQSEVIPAPSTGDGSGDTKARRSWIEGQLTFHGALSSEQMKRLEEIASRCPVHRTLRGEIYINFHVQNLQESSLPD